MVVETSDKLTVETTIDGNTILNKNNAGWFHLKKCYNTLNGIKIPDSESKDAGDPVLMNTIQKVTEALKRYRMESRN